MRSLGIWVKGFKGILILGITLGLCISGGGMKKAMASQDQGVVTVLTLEDALKIALEKNRDIQKAREYRNQVEGRYLEERAAALPNFLISVELSKSRDESQKAFGFGFPLDRETRSAQVGVSQVLYAFGAVGAAIKAAKVGISTADDQLKIYRQAALRDVTASFNDVLLVKEVHTLAKENLEQKTRHLEEARRKYAAGVATDYDVLASEVAVENARPDVIRAANLIQISLEKLRFLLGMDGKAMDVKGKLEASIAPYPIYEEALAVGRNNRPDLVDLRHRMQMAEELVTIAKATDKPRLDLRAGFGWQELALDKSSGDGQVWMGGLFLTYPIFDGFRAKGKVIQAKSNVTTLAIEEAKLLDGIALQTREAVNAVREAGEVVKALSGTVTQAERLLTMAEKGYEYGVKTKLEVDDAQLNLTLARSNLARARRDYLVALATLEWVMGTIDFPSAGK